MICVVPLKEPLSHKFNEFRVFYQKIQIAFEAREVTAECCSFCQRCGLCALIIRNRPGIWTIIYMPRSKSPNLMLRAGDSMDCAGILIQSIIEQ
jgi:hypothetical protein